MQSVLLGVGCVLLLSVFDASAKIMTVDKNDVPGSYTFCYGFYERKLQNLTVGVGGSITSFCDNMYMWNNARMLNANRRASPETGRYIERLLTAARELLAWKKIPRHKRQALNAPQRPKYRRVRKEIRMMTNKEWKTYVAAVNSAKKNTSITPNKYDALAEYHTGMTSVSAHGGCNFHGWHRMYILMYENALREEGPEFADVTVPYWDSRLDSRMKDPSESSIFTHRLLGSCQGEAKGGIMMDGWDSSTGRIMRTCGTDGPLITDGMVYNVTKQYRFGEICGEDSEIDNDLEFIHNGVHRYIDGQMAMLQSAVYDPIFWAHHTFIDLIWEIFRKNQEKHGIDVETDYPPNPTTMGAHELHLLDADLGFKGLKVSDGLSRIFTEEWYEYAPPPTCTVRRPDCRSKYLKCVVDTPPGSRGRKRARCVARTLDEVIAWEEEQSKPKPPICKNDTKGPVLGKPTPVKIIKPVQNTFCMNGKSDIGQWVYMPVKVIIRRPPQIKNFGSYPVRGGKVSKQNGDIYSPTAYSSVRKHARKGAAPAAYETCLDPDEPTNTIYVRSVGLDYEGIYKEYAIIDRRLAVTVATAYLAVRKPFSIDDVATAVLHAQDRCGRVCRPICKDPKTNVFRPCSGVVRVTGAEPLQFGNSFGDAIMSVWEFDQSTDCPQIKAESVIVSFYCDYNTDWVWPSSLQPPPPPIEKTTITPGCSLGYGCIISESCSAITPCTHGEIRTCHQSCHKYARCFNGQFYISTCRRGEFYDQNKRRCSRGFCDYKNSGVRNWNGNLQKKRGKRRRGGIRRRNG